MALEDALAPRWTVAREAESNRSRDSKRGSVFQRLGMRSP
jgi:hypothetical protein